MFVGHRTMNYAWIITTILTTLNVSIGTSTHTYTYMHMYIHAQALIHPQVFLRVWLFLGMAWCKQLFLTSILYDGVMVIEDMHRTSCWCHNSLPIDQKHQHSTVNLRLCWHIWSTRITLCMMYWLIIPTECHRTYIKKNVHNSQCNQP